MATVSGRLKPAHYPHILNTVPYKDAAELYNSGTGRLREGQAGSFRQRNGIAVTVTIPPKLTAFTYPALTNENMGTPYLSSGDAQTLIDRNNWYKAASANIKNNTKAIATVRRRIANTEKRLAQERAKQVKDVILIGKLENRLVALKSDLRELLANTADRISGTYSTEFEISDFITSLSWSSSAENSFVEVSIGLDNVNGLFNHLPLAAKITIWRRKSTSNINGLSSGKWYRYITSYVLTKSRSASGRSATMDITARDRLGYAADQHLENKKWVKDKKNHKNGWTPRDITIDICKRSGLPYDPSSLPTHIAIKKLVTVKPAVKDKNGHIVKPAVKQWQRQRVKLPSISYEPGETDLINLISGAWNRSVEKLPKKQQLKYSMHMRQGVLKVDFISPPGDPETQSTEPELGNTAARKLVYMFWEMDNIEEGKLEESMGPDEVWTVLKATGTIKVNGTNRSKRPVTRTKKVKGTFEPSGTRGKMIIEAYGKRVKNHDFKKRTFNSEREFRVAAQAKIDQLSRPVKKLSISGRAPLGIWPWYYVNIGSRFLGVKGNVAVENVNYSVENGIIKVSLDLNAEMKHYNAGEKAYGKFPKIQKDPWY